MVSKDTTGGSEDPIGSVSEREGDSLSISISLSLRPTLAPFCLPFYFAVRFDEEKLIKTFLFSFFSLGNKLAFFRLLPQIVEAIFLKNR